MDVAITKWSRHFVLVIIYYSFIIYRLLILFSFYDLSIILLLLKFYI